MAKMIYCFDVEYTGVSGVAFLTDNSPENWTRLPPTLYLLRRMFPRSLAESSHDLQLMSISSANLTQS